MRNEPWKMGDLTEDELFDLSQLRPYSSQIHYLAMRHGGESHNLAMVLASRSFPNIRTDATFLKGHANGNQFADMPALGDHYRAVSESLGQSTTGKVYLPSLAEFPGDPKAWVSGRGDIAAVCRERNWGCSGAVDVRAEDTPPTPDVDIAPDIVSDEVDRVMEGNPRLDRTQVTHEITELRAGRVDTAPEYQWTGPEPEGD